MASCYENDILIYIQQGEYSAESGPPAFDSVCHSQRCRCQLLHP